MLGAVKRFYGGRLMLAAVCFQCAAYEHEEASCFWSYEVSGVRAGNADVTRAAAAAWCAEVFR